MVQTVIYPDKNSFLYYRIVVYLVSLGIVFLVLTGLFYFLLSAQSMLFFLVVFGLGALFFCMGIYSIIDLSIGYKKTKYVVHSDKVIIYTGGLFRDSTSELLLKNVTSFYVTEPFIVRQLFGTGHVLIESAGSSISEGSLLFIENPVSFYNNLKSALVENGFSLQLKKELYREKPNVIAVFFESLKLFFLSILVGLYILYRFYEDSKLSFAEVIARDGAILIFVVVTYFLYIFVKNILTFVDMMKREYIVYTDAVTYSEGFLTLNQACIPAETISDTKITQGIIDRLLGAYDIIVSCKGSNQQIPLLNLLNAPQFKEAIDSVSKKFQNSFATSTRNSAQKSISSASSQTSDAKSNQGQKSKTPQFSTHTVRIHLARSIASVVSILLLLGIPVGLLILLSEPSFLLLLLVLFGVIFIGIIIVCFIAYKSIRFTVNPQSIESTFKFLFTSDKKFLTNTTTRIVIRENPLDWLFKTQTIEFSSLGSQDQIVFRNIPKSQQTFDYIIAACGITPSKHIHTIKSSFTVGRWLSANLPLTIVGSIGIIVSLIFALFFPLVIVASIAVIVFCVLLYFYLRWYYANSFISFYQNFIFQRKGVIFESYGYTRYDSLKDVKSVQYPFIETGSLSLNISGEVLIGSGKNQQIVSNSFDISYVENIMQQHLFMDHILQNGILRAFATAIPTQKKIAVYTESYAINLVPLTVISVILIPLLLILPFVLAIVAWSVSKRSYWVESHRVFKQSGIFYITRLSVLFEKMDSVQTSENFLDKIFSTGRVTINTIGSSSPEYTLRNVSNYADFHQRVKASYEKSK